MDVDWPADTATFVPLGSSSRASALQGIVSVNVGKRRLVRSIATHRCTTRAPTSCAIHEHVKLRTSSLARHRRGGQLTERGRRACCGTPLPTQACIRGRRPGRLACLEQNTNSLRVWFRRRSLAKQEQGPTRRRYFGQDKMTTSESSLHPRRSRKRKRRTRSGGDVSQRWHGFGVKDKNSEGEVPPLEKSRQRAISHEGKNHARTLLHLIRGT